MLAPHKQINICCIGVPVLNQHAVYAEQFQSLVALPEDHHFVHIRIYGVSIWTVHCDT